MVELKLEALDFDGSSNDTYIAVRVGESQKLSRLSALRNFKFPQSAVADRKWGKVDIFRKVGSASIGIRNDPDMMVQDLAVPCEGKNMNLRVTLQSAAAAPVADIPSGKELASKAVVEAKGYLVQHNLEMLLSDAMQAVLREKPANPSQFLAERLAGSANTYPQRAQTAPGGSRSAGAAKPDTEALRQQAKQTLLTATQDGSLDASLSKLKSSKEAAAPDDTEVLRLEAKKSLLDASANGNLALALDKVKAANAAPDAAQDEFPPAPAEAATEPAPAEAPVEAAPADAPPAEVVAEAAPAAEAAAAEAPPAEAAAEAAPGEAAAEAAPAEAAVEAVPAEAAVAEAPAAEAAAEAAPAAEAPAEAAPAEASAEAPEEALKTLAAAALDGALVEKLEVPAEVAAEPAAADAPAEAAPAEAAAEAAPAEAAAEAAPAEALKTLAEAAVDGSMPEKVQNQDDFAKIDADGDGGITADELNAALESGTVELGDAAA